MKTLYYVRVCLSHKGWDESVQEIEYKETSNSYIIERGEGHWSKTKRINKNDIGRSNVIVNTIEHQIRSCFIIDKDGVEDAILKMKDEIRSVVNYNLEKTEDLVAWF